MKRLLLLFSFLSMLSFSAIAQKTITGTISDEEGDRLIGATVQVVGTDNVGTVTDVDGIFEVTLPDGFEQIRVSYVGYITQLITVGADQSALDIVLSTDNEVLDEVVVVAYGRQSERAIVGSVASLGSDLLSKQQLASVTAGIQGSVPGVNIISAGGQPGDNPTIRIRGVGSINASASPLIIVDGAPFNGNINTISADQIESLNVLKDASATALYGSRGANGVILITTKRGQRNTPLHMQFTSSVGSANQAVDYHEFLDLDRYMELNWEAIRNSQAYVNGLSESEAAQFATDRLISDYLAYNPYTNANPVGTDGRLVTTDKKWNTDWADHIQNKNALRHEHSLNVSGGSDKTAYSFMLNYLSQEGSVQTSDFNRVTGRINLDSEINSWLTLGLNTFYSTQGQNYPEQSGTAYQSAIQWMYNVAPVYPLYRRDQNGELILDGFGEPIFDYGNAVGNQTVNISRPVLDGENAVGAFTNYITDYKRDNFVANGYGKINFTEHLSLRSNLVYEKYLFDGYDYVHNEFGYAANVGGRVAQDRDLTTTMTFINALNYFNSFGHHNISVDVIQEAYQLEYKTQNSQGTGFLPNVKVLNGSTTPENVGGFTLEERLSSYMGRVSYDFRNKYYIEGSYRLDGSSRFNEDVRWGNFYSVGASWIVSDEGFLEGSDFLSYLKLKGSYGELGNNKTLNSSGSENYFPYLQLFTTGWNNGPNTGVLLGSVTDPFLSWEKTASFNVGAELKFFRDRLEANVDYYDKESVDLIYSQPLAPSTGNESITTNVGSLRNYGVEVALTSNNVVRPRFSWTTRLNFSFDHNEITELTHDSYISGTKRWEVGRSLYEFYIQEWAGVDPQDGYGMWYKDILDSEGNPTGESETTKVYSEASRNYVGHSSLPDVIGGFSNYMAFGGFDFNFLLNFSFGAYIYDSQYAALMGGFRTPGRTASIDITDRWQNPGDQSDVPLLLASQNDFNSTSSRFLFQNDYIRLKALTLGYSLPQNMIARLGMTQLRIYLQGDNLLTWQTHKGIDPEQSLAGTTNYRSYNQRIVSFGINLGF